MQMEMFSKACKFCAKVYSGPQAHFLAIAHELACNSLESMLQYECNRVTANANVSENVIAIDEYLSTEGSTL